MWRAGSGGRLMWSADATRLFGHVAGPMVAHARRRRHTRHGHVAGGHACPRVHADTPVGRHVAMGVSTWTAHGLVGPGKKFGAVTQMRYRAPIFKLNFIQNLFHVGLCPTRFLPFLGDVAASRASIPIALRRSRGPESTRSLIKTRAQNTG